MEALLNLKRWPNPRKSSYKLLFSSIFELSAGACRQHFTPKSKIPATQSCRKYAGKGPYSAGKHRKFLENGSSIPAGSYPVDFCPLPVLSGRNRSKKIREISGWNTAYKNSPEIHWILPYIFNLGKNNP